MENYDVWRKMTGHKTSKKYPNEWLSIVEPKIRKDTTTLVSGIVQVHYSRMCTFRETTYFADSR